MKIYVVAPTKIFVNDKKPNLFCSKICPFLNKDEEKCTLFKCVLKYTNEDYYGWVWNRCENCKSSGEIFDKYISHKWEKRQTD
jgi:hypothetical protein